MGRPRGASLRFRSPKNWPKSSSSGGKNSAGKDVSLDAFIFGGRFGGPMDSNNFRHRVLRKLAEELELPKLTFQVIRRTIATLAKGHVKAIQGMMRHSKASTTTDVYMQSLEPEVRTAINSVYAELGRTGTAGPAPDPPARKMPEPDSLHQQRSATMDQKKVTEGEETKKEVPARGKLLQFAGKRLARDLLNA